MSNVKKIIKQMAKPLSILETELIYSSNNIVYERADLYYDFVLTLDDLIDSTYLGHDMMDENNRLTHFNWCWNKTCDLINTNLIKFNENNDAYIYFLDLYFETFYNEHSNNYLEVKTYWNHIFNYNMEKTRIEIDRFINLYKIFEKSYKNVIYLV